MLCQGIFRIGKTLELEIQIETLKMQSLPIMEVKNRMEILRYQTLRKLRKVMLTTLWTSVTTHPWKRIGQANNASTNLNRSKIKFNLHRTTLIHRLPHLSIPIHMKSQTSQSVKCAFVANPAN
jgi:hypothetical protein